MSSPKKDYLEETGLKFYLARLVNQSIGKKNTDPPPTDDVDTCEPLTNAEISEELELLDQ